MNLALIAAAGALGAVARYGLGEWVQARAGTFPWGTLVVNVLGSLLLGAAYRTLDAWAATPELRQAVTIGFLGAFTTFSTFSFETVALVQGGEWGRAGAYVAASVTMGLAAVALGMAGADLVVTARS